MMKKFQGKRNLGVTIIAGLIALLMAMVAVNVAIAGLGTFDRVVAFISLIFVAFLSTMVAINGRTRTLGDLVFGLFWFIP